MFERRVRKGSVFIGRKSGFVIHSLRHFFETVTVNASLPQRVIDVWLGHHSDKSMAAVYYRLLDDDSQKFMKKVPFELKVSTDLTTYSSASVSIAD